MDDADPIAPAAHVAVRLAKLSRSFRTGRGARLAVDALELDIYAGHVTALLGHNGAGK